MYLGFISTMPKGYLINLKKTDPTQLPTQAINTNILQTKVIQDSWIKR